MLRTKRRQDRSQDGGNLREERNSPMKGLRRPPTGFIRWAFRAPVALYRWHCGWLFGQRFLMLTHRGRKSGLTRQTVLEVLRYDRATAESTVISGLGAQADWYRNIQARPADEVQTGRRRYKSQQHLLSPDEAAEFLTIWESQHPLEAWLMLRLLHWTADGTPEGHRKSLASRCLVAFRPQE